MRKKLKRIYAENLDNDIISLDNDTLNYLKKTLRFKGDEEILLFNGELEILGIFNKNNTIKKIKTIREKENFIKNIAIAEIKKERLEWFVEKITELGVKTIYILKTDRSQNPINQIRLKKIIIEACKQCNRVSIPKIIYQTLTDFIKECNKNDWFYCCLKSTPHEISKKYKGAIIGPEGGWSEDEKILLKNNFNSLCLTNLTLKTETAAIIAFSKIM